MFDGLFEFCQLSAGGSAGKLGENIHFKTTHKTCEKIWVFSNAWKRGRVTSKNPIVMKMTGNKIIMS